VSTAPAPAAQTAFSQRSKNKRRAYGGVTGKSTTYTRDPAAYGLPTARPLTAEELEGVEAHRQQAAANAAAARADAEAVLINLARNDPATLAEYVLRDEETGERVRLGPVHEVWHRAMSLHDRLVMWSFIEAGKTQNLIARVLYELGHNPNLRIVVLSNTMDQAKKIVRTIGKYLSESEELRRVFPNLRPSTDQGAPWTATSLTVQRATFSKDPSVQASGLYGAIMGSRIDLLIIDDLLDQECTRTPYAMDQVFSWLRATALGRLTKKARVWAVTNEWNPKDPMHKLAAGAGYRSVRIPVITKSGKLAWPERWNRERIAKAEEDLGPLEAGRQLHLRTRDEETATINQAWLARCLARGKGYSLVYEVDLSQLPPGYSIWTGVDLAVAQHSAADWTAIVTLLLHPDGTRQILWIESGRWSGPEIVARIDNHSQRYGGIIIVENNAAQQYLLQFAEHLTRATVMPFTTGSNKANYRFGVASLGAELAAGRWIIPSNRDGKRVPKEVAVLLSDALYYDPSPNVHTGDRLMAMWFAREGARQFERSMGRKPGTGVPANEDEAPGVGVRVF